MALAEVPALGRPAGGRRSFTSSDRKWPLAPRATGDRGQAAGAFLAFASGRHGGDSKGLAQPSPPTRPAGNTGLRNKTWGVTGAGFRDPARVAPSRAWKFGVTELNKREQWARSKTREGQGA